MIMTDTTDTQSQVLQAACSLGKYGRAFGAVDLCLRIEGRPIALDTITAVMPSLLSAGYIRPDNLRGGRYRLNTTSAVVVDILRTSGGLQ